MTEEQAIQKLEEQQRQIDSLRSAAPNKPEFAKWLRDTQVAIKKIFGDESDQLLSFNNIAYSYGKANFGGFAPPIRQEELFARGLEKAFAILQSLIDEIKDYGISGASSSSPTAKDRVIQLCRTFYDVAKQLLDRYNKRLPFEITDEYDAQDLFHAVLRIDFDDIRPENWVPEYAGGSSRMDFLLKQENIVIEVKKSRPGLGAKEVGDQLLIDIGRYQTHPNCKTLICFVYDPDHLIKNPRGLEKDLTKMHGDLTVQVIIAP